MEQVICKVNKSVGAGVMTLCLLLIIAFVFTSCDDSGDEIASPQILTSFKFTHNWDGTPVTNADFNSFQFTNANGESLSIERLRYVISDITFTTSNNEVLRLNAYHLVDLSNPEDLSFTPNFLIPRGSYNVSFTFGLDNEDNARNLNDLNSASFNVPEMLGGGYHYMQLDGKFINDTMDEQGYNYHAIRAVDNPGMNPTFPQDTFFEVDLGNVVVTDNLEIEVQMNIAEWFKNPNQWDLNVLNQMLMPNSDAQIQMFENGQTVFSAGDITNLE